MRGTEPEVALAVRAAPSRSPEGTVAEDPELEEDADIDEFLSEHGFEFVDASGPQSPSGEADEEGGAFAQGEIHPALHHLC